MILPTAPLILFLCTMGAIAFNTQRMAEQLESGKMTEGKEVGHPRSTDSPIIGIISAWTELLPSMTTCAAAILGCDFCHHFLATYNRTLEVLETVLVMFLSLTLSNAMIGEEISIPCKQSPLI